MQKILLLLLCFPVAMSAQVTVFQNANIVDPRTGTVMSGDLVVDGAMITAHDDADAPADARRVDLAGRYVLPGLVDMHTHSYGNLAPSGVPQFMGTGGVARANLFAGVVAFLDLFSPEDAILGARNTQRSTGLAGAWIYAAGPCLTATNGHCSEYGVPTRIVDTPEDAVREVTELAAKRPDVVKIVYDTEEYSGRRMPTVDYATLEATVQTARAHGLKTVVHIGTWADVLDAISAGAAAVTHTPGPEVVTDDVVEIMAASGVYHIPTLAVQGDLVRIRNNSAILEDSLLVALTTEALRDAFAPNDTLTGTAAGFARWMSTLIEPNRASVKKLMDAGVPMLTGTDGGNIGVIQGFSVHRELELLVDAGADPWTALRAATSNAIDFLGGSWGVAVGDEATFVVLDGPPHEDVRHTRDIHMVVQRGQIVDRSGLLPGRGG